MMKYTFKSDPGGIKMIILKWILIIFLILFLVDFIMLSFYIGCILILDNHRKKAKQQNEQL